MNYLLLIRKINFRKALQAASKAYKSLGTFQLGDVYVTKVPKQCNGVVVNSYLPTYELVVVTLSVDKCILYLEKHRVYFLLMLLY